MTRHALCGALALLATPAIAETPWLAFQGRYLAVLSDADMLPTAYVDGALGQRPAEAHDELALFPLVNGVPGAPRRIPVSNAVTAWPSLLAFSRDGRFAYLAETDRPPAPGATRLDQLQPSPVVRVIAIGDDLNGRVIQEFATQGRAQGLSLRPQGDLLAVNIVNTPRPQLGLARVGADGRLSGFRAIDLPGAPPAPPRDLAWSPDGHLLAATFPDEHAARFYRVEPQGDGWRLVQHDDAMITGKYAGVGQWSPDGKHFFVTNLYWSGGAADRFAGANVSTLSAIRVDPSPAAKHAIVSAAAMGASAENFAIAPDGKLIVTLNMERSFLARTDARHTPYASLTLLRWDAATEQLTALATVPFDAVLPEGLSFDASGRFVAVASFTHPNPRAPAAETRLSFFRVADAPQPTLVPLALDLPVMRGAHVVKLVR